MQKHMYYAVILLHLSMISHSRREGQHRSFQIDENLILKRCRLKYCYNSKEDCSVSKCMERMLQMVKYGYCPKSGPRNSLEAICMDTCDGHDYRCPGTQKCCSHTCGRTCQNTDGLDGIPFSILPLEPENVSLMTLPHHRNMVELTWQMIFYPDSLRELIFVVEARAHSGFTFFEHKLSKWFNISFEITSTANLFPRIKQTQQIEYSAIVRLRPGRWYQFRIAALNENGTRGYSVISHQFQLKERPKNPSPPRNFTIEISPKYLTNHTCYVKVVWKHPRSDYPIEKYKITWSLYLQSNNATLNQSLLLNEAYVQEPVRSFEFWNLKPNSYYYIQLQAVSSFGRKKLKSSKESLFLNTTVPFDNTLANIQKIQPVMENRRFRQSISGKTPNIVIRFIGSKKYGMIVRVIWSNHFIGSILDLCSGEPDCFRHSPSPYKEFKTIRTKTHHFFDFIDLQFAKKYSVKLKELISRSEMTRTFMTPTCDQFQRKHTQLSLLRCPPP